MLFKKISTPEKVMCIAALGLLAGVFLSWPLWNVEKRLWFPLLPVWGGADEPPQLNSLFDCALLAGLVAIPVGIVFFFEKKWLAVLLFIWLAGCCLFDLNRLQPWVWFYLLVLIVLASGKKGNESGTVGALRWLLAAVYFWSGFSKITPYFAEDNFAWFCEAFEFTRPFGRMPVLGYAIALSEMLFAAGLMWERSRSGFRWIVAAFHVLIILFLINLDWNWVVIPWNLAMAGMAWVLFPDPAGMSFSGNRSSSSLPAGLNLQRCLLIGGAWIAPFFSYLNCWPQALSWQLYSNTQPEATYFNSKRVRYPSVESELVWEKHAFDNRTRLLFDDWANDELKVPMFGTGRTFRQLGEYLCTYYGGDSAGVNILTVDRWNKSAETMEEIPCGEMRRE